MYVVQYVNIMYPDAYALFVYDIETYIVAKTKNSIRTEMPAEHCYENASYSVAEPVISPLEAVLFHLIGPPINREFI